MMALGCKGHNLKGLHEPCVLYLNAFERSCELPLLILSPCAIPKENLFNVPRWQVVDYCTASWDIQPKQWVLITFSFSNKIYK